MTRKKDKNKWIISYLSKVSVTLGLVTTSKCCHAMLRFEKNRPSCNLFQSCTSMYVLMHISLFTFCQHVERWNFKTAVTKTNIRYPSYPTTRGSLSGLDCTRILFQFHGNNWQHRRNGHLWLEGFYWWGNLRLKSLFPAFLFYIMYICKFVWYVHKF